MLFPNVRTALSASSTCPARVPAIRLSLTEHSLNPEVLKKRDFLFSFITRPKQLVYFSAASHQAVLFICSLRGVESLNAPRTGGPGWPARRSTSSMIQTLPQPQDQAPEFHASVMFKSLCCWEQENVVKEAQFGVRKPGSANFANWGPFG